MQYVLALATSNVIISLTQNSLRFLWCCCFIACVSLFLSSLMLSLHDGLSLYSISSSPQNIAVVEHLHLQTAGPSMGIKSHNCVRDTEVKRTSKENLRVLVRKLIPQQLRKLVNTATGDPRTDLSTCPKSRQSQHMQRPENSHNPWQHSSNYRQEALCLSGALPNDDRCEQHPHRPHCVTGSCAQKRK